jgi:DNA ligase 1
MKRFAELYKQLDETTKVNAKIQALTKYFQETPPEDAVWAVNFLIGRRPKQVIPTRKLMEWCAETAGIPGWLFDESYSVVGDLAETITLLLPEPVTSTEHSLHYWIEEKFLPLRKEPEDIQKREILTSWSRMNVSERFVWNKLITGAFRVGVSLKIVIKALSEFCGIDESVIAHRLTGHWTPNADFFSKLICSDVKDADTSKPYPFYLAYQLDQDIKKLGDINTWHIEWKWDGIRSQVIKRNGEIFIWSRGEDIITERFPELHQSAMYLPEGTVIDGEILPWNNGKPLPFSELQKRIGRKNPTKKILQDIPAVIIVFDILEYKGEDIRSRPLRERYSMLRNIIKLMGDPRMILSSPVETESWDELKEARETSRQKLVEGVMLKRKDSEYKSGRKKGDWWKWKIDPFSVDAVLVYAQRGHGRRATLYTDYTFAVWNDKGILVPFAKAYSGLTDEEIRQVDTFIKQNTVERYGPVRTVKPVLVFEIAFEGIQLSSRHKSGVAVRFPRILRWRQDKKIEDADSLYKIRALIGNKHQ